MVMVLQRQSVFKVSRLQIAETRDNSANISVNVDGLLSTRRLYNKYCPSYLNDLHVLKKRRLQTRRSSTRYGTLNLVCPRYKRETEGGCSFSGTATKTWKQLPTNLKKNNSIKSLRTYFKTHSALLNIVNQ